MIYFLLLSCLVCQDLELTIKRDSPEKTTLTAKCVLSTESDEESLMTSGWLVFQQVDDIGAYSKDLKKVQLSQENPGIASFTVNSQDLDLSAYRVIFKPNENDGNYYHIRKSGYFEQAPSTTVILEKQRIRPADGVSEFSTCAGQFGCGQVASPCGDCYGASVVSPYAG